MNDSVDKYREWDAAYVLGSLSTDERREYERHLSVARPAPVQSRSWLACRAFS
jgi:anti-sigma factor RsiW